LVDYVGLTQGNDVCSPETIDSLIDRRDDKDVAEPDVPPSETPSAADLAGAQEALASDLRSQIMERVRGQQQLVVLAPAVAAAVASFAGHKLTSNPELLALLSLLFSALSLAVLRHDQEITILATHLTDEKGVGVHARVQRQWELRKVTEMQSTPLSLVMSAAQAVGIYGMPVLGALTFGVAALRVSPDAWTWFILALDAVLLLMFFAASVNVTGRYRRLYKAPTPLPELGD
jgi:hypothetical protein